MNHEGLRIRSGKLIREEVSILVRAAVQVASNPTVDDVGARARILRNLGNDGSRREAWGIIHICNLNDHIQTIFVCVAIPNNSKQVCVVTIRIERILKVWRRDKGQTAQIVYCEMGRVGSCYFQAGRSVISTIGIN